MDERGVSQLVTAALRPAINVVADIRLVVVLLCLIQLMAARSGELGLLLLIAIWPNALVLFRWEQIVNTSHLRQRVFIGLEALSAAVVILVALLAGDGLAAFGVGYLLLSALVIGALLSTAHVIWWWLLTFVPLGVFAWGSTLPDLHVAISMAASAVLAMLGRRMRRQAERVEALAADLAELRSAKAAAEERIAIARDLHETMAKSAAGTRLLAESLHSDLEKAGLPNSELAGLVLAAADATSREARAVLDQLRNGDSSDLLSSLAEDAERWAARTGLQAEVQLTGERVSADTASTWQLQRALGELLANVERHAEAEHVSIQLNADAEGLVVRVEDDGRGLPAELLDSPTAWAGQGHYGLSGVSERVGGLGGELNLSAGKKGGTNSQITVPYGHRVRRSAAA